MIKSNLGLNMSKPVFGKDADQPAHQCSLISVFAIRLFAGMRKFRIDQDFLIEHWHMIYIMPVAFAEICF